MLSSVIREVSDGTTRLCLGIRVEPESFGLVKEPRVNFVQKVVLLTKEGGGEEAGKGDLGQRKTLGN